jgi:GNAT superfamily N-acetyltransferase/uncharacterized glyoxalase superfamily protein PhnB
MENRFARAVSQLPVHDVKKTQEYYRDVLGFHIDWTWGENDYGSVSRDETTLYLSNVGDCEIPRACLIVNVREVDNLCAEWKARGAKILEEPDDKPWGLREFTLQDINGHCFRISKPREQADHVSRERVSGVTLVHRLPTVEEHRHMTQALDWSGFTNSEEVPKSLAASLFSVVAEKDGAFIGMARLTGDGAQFYYLMDVAVLPQHQGGGVGTALMNEIVDYLQKHAPEKALVTLFTGGHRISFYERFGFISPDNGLKGMSACRLYKA